jgi:hypothetical protein
MVNSPQTRRRAKGLYRRDELAATHMVTDRTGVEGHRLRAVEATLPMAGFVPQVPQATAAALLCGFSASTRRQVTPDPRKVTCESCHARLRERVKALRAEAKKLEADLAAPRPPARQ